MMKYKSRYWIFISYFVKKSIRRRFSKKETNGILNNAKAAYIKLLERAYDIGSDNPMADNLYMAIAFVAFHVGNDDIIKEEQLGDIIQEFFENKSVYKLIGMMNINNPKHFKKMKKSLLKSSDWIEARREQYPESWEFNYDDTHKDGFYYYFTKCPIAKFFKENGLESYMPLICGIDYITIGLVNGKLYRDHTIAKDGTICDFWIVPDNIKDPK